MFAVGLVYAGLILILLGGVSLLKPPTFLGIRNRQQGAVALALGLIFTAAGCIFPAREVRVAAPRTQLDRFMPAYQFHEVHSIRVLAPRDRVYRAIKAVPADEIRFFRTLTWVRRLGRPGREGILNAPERLPLLEVATRTGFLLLAEEPDREIVLGTAVAAPRGWRPKKNPAPEDFRTVRDPGFALAAMNFLIEDAGPGACTVTTETRVYATDAATQRRFAPYWRTIYPGSALIRRMWLRAAKRRAETAQAPKARYYNPSTENFEAFGPLSHRWKLPSITRTGWGLSLRGRRPREGP